MPSKSLSIAGRTGRKSDIGSTPSRLRPDTVGLQVVNEGVQMLASPNNDDTIWVGYSNNITADSDDDTDGFPLVAGASLFLPCRHISDIWVRSTSTSNQVLWFVGQ